MIIVNEWIEYTEHLHIRILLMLKNEFIKFTGKFIELEKYHPEFSNPGPN